MSLPLAIIQSSTAVEILAGDPLTAAADFDAVVNDLAGHVIIHSRSVRHVTASS